MPNKSKDLKIQSEPYSDMWRSAEMFDPVLKKEFVTGFPKASLLKRFPHLPIA